MVNATIPRNHLVLFDEMAHGCSQSEIAFRNLENYAKASKAAASTPSAIDDNLRWPGTSGSWEAKPVLPNRRKTAFTESSFSRQSPSVALLRIRISLTRRSSAMVSWVVILLRRSSMGKVDYIDLAIFLHVVCRYFAGAAIFRLIHLLIG